MWSDQRNLLSYDIYAQRVQADGSIPQGWPLDGLPVCTAPDIQSARSILGVGLGAGIAAWFDWRAYPAFGVYAARVPFDDVVATSISLSSVETDPLGVRLRWYGAQHQPRPAKLYRSPNGEAWIQLAEMEQDNDGYWIFEDSSVLPGSRYGYRLAFPQDGPGVFVGETWIEVPSAFTLGLEGAQPNPSRSGQLAIHFVLPVAAPARLEVLDVAGRLVAEREVSSLGPGRHSVSITSGTRISPGVYLVRLSQGGRVRYARAVVLR